VSPKSAEQEERRRAGWSTALGADQPAEFSDVALRDDSERCVSCCWHEGRVLDGQGYLDRIVDLALPGHSLRSGVF
jgi:hypothetical protein